MLSWRKTIYLPICFSLASVLSACGGQAYQTPPSVSATAKSQTPVAVPTNPADVWDPTNTTPTPTTPVNLPTPIAKSFKLQDKATSSSVCTTPTPSGVTVGSYTVSNINTDNMMKVTIRANAPSALPCSTATMAYSCLNFRVTVGTREKEIKVSYGSPTAGPCAGVPNSVTEDFSDQAPAGHGPLSVIIEDPQMDNCRLYYGYAQVQGTVAKNWSSYYFPGATWIAPGAGTQYSGCPMGMAYDNYIASGAVSVQTNTP